MLTTWHPQAERVGTGFADRWFLLGRYSSLADSGHGVYAVWYLSLNDIAGTMVSSSLKRLSGGYGSNEE
jgi:hypothetical protein